MLRARCAEKEDFACKSYPEGLEMRFGNAEAAIALAKMIRDREGIGDILSNGTRIASKIIDAERGTES